MDTQTPKTPTQPDLAEAKKKVTSKKPVKAKAKRKGKKSIAWDRDPEILARLASVAEMLLVGAKPYQIALALNEALSSAKRDVARVKQLWQEEARDEIDTSRNAALAQYKLVLMRAWDEYGKKENAGRKHLFLNIVTSTQKEIDRVQGVGPQKIDLSGKIDVVEDIDKVRERRWKQIRPKVAEMLQQIQIVKG
jgi:hypothetical protein